MRLPAVLCLSFTLCLLVSARADTPSGPRARSDLLSAVDEIARSVVTVRGLALKRPLQRGVLTREQISQKLQERINKEYTPAEVRTEASVLKRLGLLPEDADYEKLLFELLSEQVAGFYDPSARTLYVADWLPLEMQRPALAHEIEHALQDQHFDLARFSQPLKEESDRQLARAALVEGDGTAVMLEFVAQSMGLSVEKLPEMVTRLGKQMMEMSVGTTPAFHRAPAVLRETLIFPYAAGLDFVESIRLQKKWSQVDKVFQRPPRSTEQVMHPEKYWSGEEPVQITAAPLSLPGYKEIRRDVLGEMLLKIFFAQRGTSEAAEAAAAGWGGDRMVAYQPDGAEGRLPLVVLATAWDTEEDARDAEAAAQRVLLSMARARPEGRDESYAAERRGSLVAMVLGAPAAQKKALLDQVLRTWKVTRPPRSTPPSPPSP